VLSTGIAAQRTAALIKLSAVISWVANSPLCVVRAKAKGVRVMFHAFCKMSAFSLGIHFFSSSFSLEEKEAKESCVARQFFLRVQASPSKNPGLKARKCHEPALRAFNRYCCTTH